MLAPIARRSAVLALVFFWILGQALTWGSARDPWRDSLSLWGAAVASAPDTKLARVNWALALNSTGRHAEAAQSAESWIGGHGGPKLENCRLYANAMQAELALGHDAKARELAAQSAPFASCDPGLASAAGALLMPDQKTCPLALGALRQAQVEGDGLPGSNGFWSFESPEQREGILSRLAFAEARCGSVGKARTALDDLSRKNQKWAEGAPLRESLLRQAIAGRTAPAGADPQSQRPPRAQ